VCLCVCVCVCARARARTHVSLLTHSVMRGILSHRIALAVRGAIRLGRLAGRAEGTFSHLRDMVNSLRFAHTHAYRQSVMRDAVRKLLLPGSPHAAAAMALCKDSARAFLVAAEATSDEVAGALYDGLANGGE
jgi:hypothetical protein